MEMANASGCQLVFAMHQIPLLDGVTAYATQGIFPGGATNNRRFFEPTVTCTATLSEAHRRLLWDPQTSGGLFWRFRATGCRRCSRPARTARKRAGSSVRCVTGRA